jgi:hypothetical protein
MTTIPRRRVRGTGLDAVALLYRDVTGKWRYRLRDRNLAISPARARRVLAAARAVPGAHIDRADVEALSLPAEFDAVLRRHGRVLQALADERDQLDDDEGTTA